MLGSGWLSPRKLVLGSVSVLASCTALGLSATGVHLPKLAIPSSGLAAALNPFSLAPAAAHSSTTPPKAPPAAAPAHPPCPPEMVLVARSCVDRYEAHLLEPGEGGALVVHPPHEKPERKRYVAASSVGTKPQAYICQIDAAAACRNAGKRLCSLTEWYRACTGPSGTTYPYGAKYQKGRCNVNKPHLLSVMHGADPNSWTYDNFNDPKLDLTPGFLAFTGEYEDCQSSEGVHDMVGNLHEWVADRVDGTLRSKLPVLAVLSHKVGRHSGNGIFMGGFFSTLNQHGEGCTFATAAHDPAYHDYSTGFRCCADPSVDEK